MKTSFLQDFGALFHCLLASNVARKKSKDILSLTSQKATYVLFLYQFFQEFLLSLDTLKFRRGVSQCGYQLALGNLSRKIFILSPP